VSGPGPDAAQPRCELCAFEGSPEPFYPDLHIVRCPACGLVYYDGSAPGQLYTREYFAGGEYHDYLADKATLQRNFARRIVSLRKLKPGGRLLEIGAAYGFFLELAQSHWEARGLEISRDAVEHARRAGLNVDCADFLDQPDEPASYDLICLWDTIEHLAHPVRYIEKAARWLKPEGYLALTTGNVTSFVSRLRKQRWRLVHPPTHLYYFSPATLRRAAEGAGLQMQRCAAIGYFRSYRSMVHALALQGTRHHPALYSLATLGGRLDIPVYLNLYDIVMMVARKGEST
jgi:cyclopropane fatty-acyl-phospholipid synthase-like methyltransferase